MCKIKGLANQRTERCNEYVMQIIKRVDLLGWCDK